MAKLDVVVGRRFPFEPDTLVPDPVVAIDDVRPMSAVRRYAVCSHVADKVAAMDELHGSSGESPSTRSHDLADIVIFSRCARVDAEELRAAVHGQEQRRGVVVPTPLSLPRALLTLVSRGPGQAATPTASGTSPCRTATHRAPPQQAAAGSRHGHDHRIPRVSTSDQLVAQLSRC